MKIKTGKAKKAGKALKAVKAIVSKIAKSRITVSAKKTKSGWLFTLSDVRGTGNVIERNASRSANVIMALAKKYKSLYGEANYDLFRKEASVPLAVDLKCDSKAKASGTVKNTKYDACCDEMATACNVPQMLVKNKGTK